MPSIRSLPSVGALAAAMLFASCGERPTMPIAGGSEVLLRIVTEPAFQQSGVLFVQVRVTYARASGTQVALFDEPIPLSSASAQQLSVSVDIAPCLNDPDRSGPSTSCTISVRLGLLDAAKAELDSRTVGPLVVAPDQTPAPVAATLNSRYTLGVSRSGSGSGAVNFSPAASSPTGGLFTANTNVTLTAAPSATSTFGGWSGSCTGTSARCTVRMDANKTVNAAFDTTFAITVTMAGSGSGTVTASPAGPRYVPGASVTLTAAPSSGSLFSGWSGACSGTSSTCALTMSTNLSVTATFVPIPTFSLTVTKSGTGTGTVSTNPSGTSFQSGTAVALTATANAGSVFVNWSGDCSGTASTCVLTMTANRSVNAVFNLANTTYDGDYSGTFTGSASGSVVFTVRNGAIAATLPGSGQGTVSASGSVSFTTMLAAGGCTKQFTGSISVFGNGFSGGGSWVCGTESGTWSVTGTRVP